MPKAAGAGGVSKPPGDETARSAALARARTRARTKRAEIDARPLDVEAGPTTVAQFLDLDEVEMRVIDLRVGLTLACRRLRVEAGLTQGAVAKRLGIARTRLAEIEKAANELTFDSLIPLFCAAGGTADEFARLVRATDDAMSR